MKTAKGKKVITWVILIIVIVIFMFPLYYNIAISFMDEQDIAASPPKWIFKPTLINYKQVLIPGFVSKKAVSATLSAGHLLNNMKNSVIICFSSVLLSLGVGTFAAYALARFSFRHKEDLAFWIISIKMMPPIATIIPFFLLSQSLKIYDTHLLMIIVYMTINLPLTVWIMRGFFEDIPVEIEESAMIDGCSRMKVFYRIMLPLATPGLIATAIICLIFSWNEFFMAFLLTGRNSQTLPVSLAAFMTPFGTQWGALGAANALTIAPIIIIAIVIQKYLVRGLTFGAIK